MANDVYTAELYHSARSSQKMAKTEDLLQGIPESVWRGRVVVNSKPVGNGKRALAYLAPYVTRGCVGELASDRLQ